MEEEFFHDIAFYTSQENRQSIGGFGKVFNSDKVNAPVVNTDSIGDFSNSAKLDLGVNSKAVLSLQNDPNDPALSFLTDEAVAIRCQSNIYLLSDSPIRVDDFNRGGSGSLTVNGACTVNGDFNVNSGTKNFQVHDATNDRTITHSCIESNLGGQCVYRYRINTKDESIIDLPDYYSWLTLDDAVVICQPVNHFGSAYGVVTRMLGVMVGR
jgi:hypothetical protein